MKLYKKKIYFTYPDCISYSGQTKASELIIELFSKSDEVIFIKNIFPTLNRKKKGRVLLTYLLKLVIFYYKIITSFFIKKDVVYLNLGQSLSKFITHALPIVLLYNSKKIVVSLHGNNFLDWEKNSLHIKLFKFILSKVKLITILGDNQKKGLEALDIYNVVVLPNCIDIEGNNNTQIEIKQSTNKITILHLSLLIESKGFPLIIKSLKNISKKSKEKLQFKLCGPIAFTTYCKMFSSHEEKHNWIENEIETLNNLHVKSEWIKGAKGEEKSDLYNNSNIFVFPSSFPVESQPLVLLEAAASGCAIITSRVGEIEEMFEENEVLFLDNNNEDEILEKIELLIQNDKLRKDLALKAREKFTKKYSRTTYYNNWNNIFKNISK